VPHYGPSSPAHPTIKKNKERGVKYFETKGTKPSITIDLLLHHCQTITSPSSCHQRRHHHPRTKQHPTNTAPYSLSFSSPSPVITHFLSLTITSHSPYIQAPSPLSQKNTLSRQPLETKSRDPPILALERQTLMIVTTNSVGHH